MSPGIALDVEFDSDGPGSLLCSQTNDSTSESSYPGPDRKWAIGDDVNEPIAIVGIGILTTPR